ncbi:MAG: cupin domain-containing protein [Archaeoglobus sp.]|nr:cupin domain-containing protein [Archaeoglobus sp.]
MKFDFESSSWVERDGYRTKKVFDIAEDSFVQIVEIKPKAEVKKHYHVQQTEVFYIMDGKAKLGLGEKEYAAEKGDIFLCRPKTVHWVVNDSENPFRVLVFKYGWKENDTVWLS